MPASALDAAKRRTDLAMRRVRSGLDALECEAFDDLVYSVWSGSRALSRRSCPNPEIVAAIASKNKVNRSFIGQGYYDTITPPVILRNVLENPSFYTQYTPYQAEIAQGRLEALLNFQTMIADLTGLPIANASLLDEATAAAEAMTMARRVSKSKSNVFFIDEACFAQTIDVVRTRAHYFGYELVYGKAAEAGSHDCFGALLQYPGSQGALRDFRAVIAKIKAAGALAIMAESYRRIGRTQLGDETEQVLKLNYPEHPYLAGNWPAKRSKWKQLNPFSG